MSATDDEDPDEIRVRLVTALEKLVNSPAYRHREVVKGAAKAAVRLKEQAASRIANGEVIVINDTYYGSYTQMLANATIETAVGVWGVRKLARAFTGTEPTHVQALVLLLAVRSVAKTVVPDRRMMPTLTKERLATQFAGTK